MKFFLEIKCGILRIYCVPMQVYKMRSKARVMADMYMSLLAMILVAGRLAPHGGYICLLLVEACFRVYRLTRHCVLHSDRRTCCQADGVLHMRKHGGRTCWFKQWFDNSQCFLCWSIAFFKQKSPYWNPW